MLAEEKINKQAFIACERKRLSPDEVRQGDCPMFGKTNFEHMKERIQKEALKIKQKIGD